MTTDFKIDLFDPTIVSDAWKTALEYRVGSKVDSEWELCFERDNPLGVNEILSGEQSSIARTISLPIIYNNNSRKEAAIGVTGIKPIIYSETYGSDQYTEIRGSVIRWAVRASKLIDAISASNRKLVSIGNGTLKLVWDKEANDGRGAPLFLVKDPRNVYFDPRRRQWDINLECRWVFEKQHYTRAEAQTYWPDYFDKVPGAKLEDKSTSQFSTHSEIRETPETEGGDIDLVSTEFVTRDENNRKIVMAGLFDPSMEEWVVKPAPNGMRMFSYFPNSLPPLEGYAYPKAPNLAEFEMTRLANLLWTLYIHTALNNSDGPVFYKHDDAALEKALNGRSHFELGEWVATDNGDVPQQMKRDGQDSFLSAAQNILAIANESGNVQAVQRGEAPRGVSSGRALNILTSTADLSIEQYRTAVRRTFVQACTGLDRLLRTKIQGYRKLIIRDGQEAKSVHLNVKPDSDLYERIKSDESSQFYESARMYKKQGDALVYVGNAPIEEAEDQKNAGEIEDFEVYLNDLMAGDFEVDVQIEQIQERAERKQNAVMLAQMDKLDLVSLYAELGYDNPQLMAGRLAQEKEILQIGEMVMNNPELMNALNVLSSDPFLMQFISNPEATGEFKMEMARRAAKRNASPSGG